MSSIFSLLTLANAFEQITAGYAKLHESDGTPGLSAALRQISGGQSLDTLMQTVEQAGRSIAPSTTDTYEFSAAAMDHAFAFQTQQLPPTLSADPADVSPLAPAASSIAPSPSASPARHANPLPTIQALANLHNPYPFGNNPFSPMLDVLA